MKHRAALALSLFGAFLLGMLALHPIARAVEFLATTTCERTAACIGGANGSPGPGVIGTSLGGNGVNGATTFTSTTPASGRAGVIGQDLSKSGLYDVGVRGISIRGTGVVGKSTNLIGVQGVLSGTKAKNAAALEGIDESTAGQTDAIYATTAAGNGLYVVADGGAGGVAADLFATSGSDLITAYGAQASFFGVDYLANIATTGEITTSGSCSIGCSPVRHVRSTAAMTATPTLEDAGEAQLHAGSAYVRLEPRFANSIDPKLGYLVLITPEGDTRGLFVAQRGPAGFEVRETGGGRSTLAFAYRIVAHPFGRSSERLPFVDERPSLPARPPGASGASGR